MNTNSSQKVKRWKLIVQEYDFDIEHIAGVKNTIADAFSRLVAKWTADFLEPNEDYLYMNVLLTESLLCTMSEEHLAWLQEVHNADIGHGGVDRTMDKLKKAGRVWPHMRDDVRKFIRQCPCCQKMSYVKAAVKVNPFTRAAYNPMEVLSIDTAGPLLEDGDSAKYILVVVDNFTRWIELYPLRDTTAEAAAIALVQHIGRFGVPEAIRTDKGTQFVYTLWEELGRILNFKHEVGTPYSKEENAIAERSIGEVMRHLKALLFDRRVKDKWSSEQLPLVQRILNSEVHSSTGVSPADLLFGDTVNLNRRLIGKPVQIQANNLADYVSRMLEAQDTLIKVAQETQKAKDEFHMSRHSVDFPTEFPVNSYVLVTHPANKRSKLHLNKTGPYRVVNFVGSTYTLQDLVNEDKNFDIHVSSLTPFEFDPVVTDPKEVAIQDAEEFYVESVLDHRGDKTKKTTMQFLVKWKGFPDSENSWEPWKNLIHNEILHNYLKEHRMKSLIPVSDK